MNKKTNRALEELQKAQAKGNLAKLKTYSKLSGPGWMQSAITLGGGSLTGALFLGVISGYSMLWVPIVAMILGVIMLNAISYVTLSTQRSPFELIRNDINPVLAWGWLAASLVASVVWSMPQYSLAYAAVTQNIAPDFFQDANSDGTKYLVSFCFLAVLSGVTLFYGKKGRGIQVYEIFLKLIVAGVVIAFVGVVIKLATTAQDFNMSEVLRGLIPNLGGWNNPAASYQSVLAGIDNEVLRNYWTEEIVSAQRIRVVATASAAVGINMTFLLPYSLLNKGWTKEFRGLVTFDLSTGMIIPFAIVVTCVTIAASYMFHGKESSDLLTRQGQGQELVVNKESVNFKQYEGLIKKRNSNKGLAEVDVTPEETKLVAMLVKRDSKDFANSLSKLTGSEVVAHKIFGLGVMAMALSSASLLMLICGYVICEMLGKPHGGKVHKIGIFCGAAGVFWPFFWSGGSKAFLGVIASAFGYVLLPIAYLTFFIMMNSRKVLGAEMPRGKSRFIWNSLMGISLVTTGVASGWTATQIKWPGTQFAVGAWGMGFFVLLVILGQVYMRKKNRGSEAGL